LLRINKKKSDNRFKTKENDIEEGHKFAYLGRVVTNTSGVQEYVKIHICNINTAFIQLYQSWNARKIYTAKKVKTFRRNIKSVHLYGCKIWKVVKRFTQNNINQIKKILQQNNLTIQKQTKARHW
jgi:hypothetical protein